MLQHSTAQHSTAQHSTKLTSFFAPIALSIFLAGCGGGGDGSTSSGASAVTNTTGKVSEPETEVLTGFFRDSAIEGLDYVSCNASFSKCLEGITDADGAYLYRQGYTVQFKLGGLVVAETQAMPLLTPKSVSKLDADATKLAQFLQSLDVDNDPSNGIKFSEATRSLAKTTFIAERLVNKTIEQATQPFVTPDKIVTSSKAVAHAQASERLLAASQSGNEYARAFLGQLAYPASGSYHLQRLKESAKARLELQAWVQYRSTMLMKISELSNLTEVEKERNRLVAVVDTIKGFVDIASLAINVPNDKSNAELALYVAKLLAISGGSVAQIPKAIEGEGAVPDWATDGAKGLAIAIESIPESKWRALLQGGDVVKAGIDLTDMDNEDKEVWKAAVDPVMSLASMALALVKNIKIEANPIDAWATITEKSLKTAIDARAAYKLARNTNIRNTMLAAIDYLDAYYKSAGDANWMLKYYGIHIERWKAINDLNKKYNDSSRLSLNPLDWLPGFSIRKDDEYGFHTLLNEAFSHVAGEEKLINSLLNASEARLSANVTANKGVSKVCVGTSMGFKLSLSKPEASTIGVVWSSLPNVTMVASGLHAAATFNKAGYAVVTAVVDARLNNKAVSAVGSEGVLIVPCATVINLQPQGGLVISEQVQVGSDIGFTYTAKPSTGYRFDGWYDQNGNLLSTSAVFEFNGVANLNARQLTPKLSLIEPIVIPTVPKPPVVLPENSAKGTLNDTGIIFGYSAYSPLQEDYAHGRDAQAIAGTLAKVGSSSTNAGKANGFDFTKISSTGQPLPANAVSWDCVLDNNTGLMWENKTDDNGLRDKDNTYTWYNTDTTNNGGNAGRANGGTCLGGTGCDTQKYVSDVNTAGLCGYTNWRMPTVEELQGIADMGRNSPAIDPSYFPNTASGWYWSSSAFANGTYNALCVYFVNGFDDWSGKNFGRAVRLVRSQ